MAIAVPIWLQAGSYSAKRDRQALAANWDEGVLKPRSFKPTQTGSPTYAVAVAVGRAVVQGDDEPDQGNYIVTSDAVETVAWPAPPGSNSRIDILVLRVNDPNAGGPAGSNATLAVISGTAAASPVAPAIPNSAMPICRVTVVAAQTTITNAQITDLRVPAGKVEEVGTLKAYSGGVIPSNWILADGVDKLRATYPELNELYSSLGYPYGAGNGTTTFGIPDGQGRIVIGAGGGFTIGAEAGAATATLTYANLPAHTHTGPSHTHSGPSHTHTGPSHTHSVSGTTSNNGFHSHNYSYGYGQAGSQGIIGTGVSWFFLYSNNGTDGQGAHDHTWGGTTTADGTGNTGASGTAATGASGTAATGSVGGPGTDVNVTGPHVVVGGLLIRAA